MTRVLVVQDSPTQAQPLRLILESQGCEVEVAGEGQQAIERLQGSAFDLVVRVSTFEEALRLHQELRESQAALQAAQAELEAANRMKDEFLATLTHELRTPLNAIVGWVHILRGAKDDPALLDRAVETIARNAKVQDQLIGDILDVSRMVAGKLRLERAPVDLASVVQAAVDTVQPEAEAKGVSLRCELEPLGGQVTGAAGRLQQVVWNLLKNAIKFTPPGGSVVARVAPAASGAEVVVSDSGSGIGPEFLPFVFDRFRQAEGGTRSHGGLGLGLAIVKHLMELHGGTARAESAGSGQGATFTITLPLRAAAPPGPPEAKAEPREPSPSPRALQGLKVLVVDDQEDSREVIQFLLEHHGAAVTAAGSAGQAFAAFERDPPAIVLSDLEMPGESGLSFIAKVRALPAERGGKVPAVALTGQARPQDRARALEAGFQTHLTKPVEPERVLEVVRSLARPPGQKP